MYVPSKNLVRVQLRRNTGSDGIFKFENSLRFGEVFRWWLLNIPEMSRNLHNDQHICWFLSLVVSLWTCRAVTIKSYYFSNSKASKTLWNNIKLCCEKQIIIKIINLLAGALNEHGTVSQEVFFKTWEVKQVSKKCKNTKMLKHTRLCEIILGKLHENSTHTTIPGQPTWMNFMHGNYQAERSLTFAVPNVRQSWCGALGSLSKGRANQSCFVDFLGSKRKDNWGMKRVHLEMYQS